MSATGPRSINCTSCGAGQNVMGGGRVTVHVCDFCGAAMDASHDFEVLAQFSKAQDLGSPFMPGMSGEIDGIGWVVIGTLQRSERWHGEVDTWYEHQLYSESHGYAWLSVEDGHLVFSRRMRGEVQPEFVTTREVERAEHRPSIRIMDNWTAYGELDVPLSKRLFKYHESGTYKTDAAAGSFTWLPRVGEVDRTVTFVRDTEALHCTESKKGEREIVLSRYLPADETYDSFGVAETDRAPRGRHVLEPFYEWIHAAFVKRVIGFCALASLALALFILISSSQQIGTSGGVIPVTQLPKAVPFEVKSDGRLVRINLTAFPENGFSAWDVEIVGPDGETVGFHPVGIQRYSGRDSDGAWSEGSSSGRVVLRPTMAGEHKAIVTFDGFEPWSGGRNPAPPSGVDVEVRAKRGAARWPFIAAGVFALLFVAFNLPKAAHNNRRASLSDWIDEGDDD